MQACWNENAEERPTFSAILTMLNNIPDELLAKN